MTDFSTLNFANVDDLFSALKGELITVSTTWFNKNESAIAGYLRSLAEAALQTQVSLIAKQITPETADIIMHNQELAFNQVIKFTEFMTLVLAQQLMDAVFRVIGWAIYNATKINLFPALVQPGS